PILTGQWIEATREYGVFRLLLTGLDDSSVAPETEVPDDARLEIVRKPLSPDAIAQMISDYEEELARGTDNPDGLDEEEDSIDAELDELQATIRAMEGKSLPQANNGARPMRPTRAWLHGITKSWNCSIGSDCWISNTLMT